MDNVAIFTTEASEYLAQLIAANLNNIPLGETERRSFPGGENYLRLGINHREELMGKTAIFVGSTHTDLDFAELCDVVATLADYGTKRRIVIIPFFGYSTMERAKLPGEVVRAKTRAADLSAIPNTCQGNTFLMLDLHTPGLIHYFEGDCLRHQLYARQVLTAALRKLLRPTDSQKMIFGSADLGRPDTVQLIAEEFGTDLAFINKSRRFTKTEVLAVIGDVQGKAVIIYDDMIRSGNTLIDAAKAYLEKGATTVHAIISHLAFNDAGVIDALEDSPIERIIGTNSHPMSQHPLVQQSRKITVVDVAPVFVEAIRPILTL